MKLKLKLFSVIACNMAIIIGSSAAYAQELDGDQKDACEAILCLSSGQRPTECIPPLQRYFSIKKKTSAKTANARRAFLSLCPSVSSDTAQSLIDSIVNGSGSGDE
ncbi:MAG: hypothetical protein LBV29_09105 [Azoarcus sp.]|jgi:hypothetical protein|nr:hypothetical protein [Azoarcus sp.]